MRSQDGRGASACTIWFDPVNAVGLFESVGTHPDFRGKGLGKAADFIGKQAYAEKAAKNTLKMARFRMNDKGVRPSKQGDPVLDKHGRVIGMVTSCAQDSEGYLLGMAMIEGNVAKAMRPSKVERLAFCHCPKSCRSPSSPLPHLARMLVPDAATVISRFPPRKS